MLTPSVSLAEEIQRSRDDLWDLLRDYMASYAVRRPIRKVSVIGNAPLSPSDRRADELDSADLVIRTNALMLDEVGGLRCVGRACHVAIVSVNTTITPWVLHDYRSRCYLAPQAGWDVHRTVSMRADFRLESPFWPADLGVMPIPNATVKARLNAALDPERGPGTLIPTTGTMALFLAHEMFGDAELAGAGFSFVDDEKQQAWDHHSGSHTKVHPHHDLALEAKLLRSWLADGSLHLLR